MIGKKLLISGGVLLLVLATMVAVFSVRKWKKHAAMRDQEASTCTPIRADRLKHILAKWDETQNAGCLKEWDVS